VSRFLFQALGLLLGVSCPCDAGVSGLPVGPRVAVLVAVAKFEDVPGGLDPGMVDGFAFGRPNGRHGCAVDEEQGG